MTETDPRTSVKGFRVSTFWVCEYSTVVLGIRYLPIARNGERVARGCMMGVLKKWPNRRTLRARNYDQLSKDLERPVFDFFQAKDSSTTCGNETNDACQAKYLAVLLKGTKARAVRETWAWVWRILELYHLRVCWSRSDASICECCYVMEDERLKLVCTREVTCTDGKDGYGGRWG